MKNFKLSTLALGLMLFAASCKKNDMEVVAPIEKENTTQWNSISNWSSTTIDEVTTHFSKVSDSTITAEVIKSGVVLVFKKEGNQIQSLPFQEKESKTFWYHQVSDGSVRINSENHKGQDLAQQSFSYYVISPAKLSSLETSGVTRFELLDMSYEQVKSLLK